jgi:NADH:ubiquinone oxidoreductase subunit 4 (subunit M)
VPLLVLIFVIGLAPAIFFELMDGSVSGLVSFLNETTEIAGR